MAIASNDGCGSGAPIARDAATLEAGAAGALAGRGVASVSYGGQFGEAASEQRVKLDLRLAF